MGSTADYWVGTTIAEGAFGTVVYGQHKVSRLPVAIKCVSKAVMAKQPVTAVQLVQEQKILKRLNERTDGTKISHDTSKDATSSNSSSDVVSSSAVSTESSPFVRLHASFHDAHCVYIVTELCLGGTLQDVIASQEGKVTAVLGNNKSQTAEESSGNRSNNRTWREHYGWQILQALSALHDAGIVHCDLKPQNVLLTQHGRVKLADFGSAIGIVRAGGQQVPAIKFTPRGSPGYAAPELLRPSSTIMAPDGTDSMVITVAADLWSLGCVLFALWMGVSPFQDSGSEALTLQRSQDYCALQEDKALRTFVFPAVTNYDNDDKKSTSDNAIDNNNNHATSAAEEDTGNIRNSNQEVPQQWQVLISSLLRPKPSERAGMSDLDTRTKDGKLYPSLHQSDVWRDVDTTKNPSLLPVVPRWWIEQQKAEKNDDGLKDGADGWSAFLV